MAKTTRVVMPQLGESVHEGTISKWLVKPGDKVVEFEPMVEVDTDKVNAEVPAPVSGILREILAQEGQTVQAGAEIAVVEVGSEGEVGASPEAPAPAPAVPAPKPKPEIAPPLPSLREDIPAGRGGEDLPAEPGGEDVSALRRGEKPEAAPPLPAGSGGETGDAHRYSPAVQMVASELKVDLSRVSGTGMGGRVTKKDVQEFAARAQSAPSAPAAPLAAKPGEGDQVVPLTRVRRLIAENMSRSKSTIPHAWQTQEADMSGVVANRSANKAAFQKQEGFSLTYLPYVIAATVSALREHPGVNATFNETELIVHRDINVGVSVGLEDTLVVPVIR
ncbi:MAG: dihydrolipoamide acetyltransferase family protein, partial [Hyphomicrobiales bacterium]